MHYAQHGKRFLFPKAMYDMGENMPQTAEHAIGLATALRDFFSAGCAAELAAASPALSTGRILNEDESRELEYEFNRLFVGPDVISAPPFASVYLEKEPQLMGHSTLEVRELYLGLGLAVPEGGNPDDFLPYELDAWIRLCTLELEVSNEQGKQTVREARRWLVLEHMARWIPVFIERASLSSPSPIMADILKALENWLHSAQTNV